MYWEMPQSKDVDRVTTQVVGHLAEQIRPERVRRGLSLRVLSSWTGLSKSAVHRIETGHPAPSKATFDSRWRSVSAWSSISSIAAFGRPRDHSRIRFTQPWGSGSPNG